MHRWFPLKNIAVSVSIAMMGTSACSTIQTSRTTQDSQLGEISVSKYGVEGFYKPAGVVTAEATVTVTITDNGERKIIDGEDFQIDYNNKSRIDRSSSNFYVGDSIPVVTVGGAGGAGGLLSANPLATVNPFASNSAPNDEREYATNTVNYRLIKKALAAGAAAFLDPPRYEWSIQEESKYETIFFFFEKLQSKKTTYKVSASAHTATLEYRSVEAPKASPAQKPEQAGSNKNSSSPSISPSQAPTDPEAIVTDKKNLLDLDVSTVRSLKQLIGKRVKVGLDGGLESSGTLESVERAGLTADGKVTAWETIENVRPEK